MRPVAAGGMTFVKACDMLELVRHTVIRSPLRSMPVLDQVTARPAELDYISGMGTEQYHEPPGELGQDIRTFARMAASLQEEAEAIGWYEQRIALERDPQAKAIMRDAQQEEFKHFAMALEFLSRKKPKWQAVLKEVLFKPGAIVEHGEEGEEAEKKA